MPHLIARPELAFPLDEYLARRSATRTRMNRAGFDALVVTSPENICYLSGFESAGYANPQALLLGADGAMTLVTRALEIASAEVSCAAGRIVALQDHETLAGLIAAELGRIGAAHGRLGIETASHWLSVAQRDALAAALQGAAFADSFGIVEAGRRVKSPRELDAIRTAGGIAVAAMQAAFDALGEGKRERDVAAEAYRRHIAAGSEWIGLPLFISSGPRSARGHNTWSDRVLNSGDPVFLETNAAHRRYHAGLMRAAFIGRAGDRFRSMQAACVAGLEAALDAVRAGVPASTVDAACRAAIDRAGWGDAFRLRSGYSVGIGFENFGEGQVFSLHRNNHAPLEAGMVLHIVPYLAEAGVAGAGVSDTIIVTEGGHELVAPLPRDLVER